MTETKGFEEYAVIWQEEGYHFLSPALKRTRDRRAIGIWTTRDAERIARLAGDGISARRLEDFLTMEDIARARDVSQRLATAYLIFHGFGHKPWPAVDDITAVEAANASRIVTTADRVARMNLPPGATYTFNCVVAADRAAEYLGYALVGASQERATDRTALDRLPAEDRAILAEGEEMELIRALRAEGLLA